MVTGKGLQQCLDRSEFNYESDMLIQLGDIVDGWYEIFECFEILNKIQNKILIRGNHDEWFSTFIRTGLHTTYWQSGGIGTFNSYVKHDCSEMNNPKRNYITNLDIPESHQQMIGNQIAYYIDDQNRCFVHGGFDREYLIEKQIPDVLQWNRNLWNEALSCSKDQKLNTKDDFSEIFIGHTATTNLSESLRFTQDPSYGKPIVFPIESGGVWNLDTGSGWKGKLTIMDVDTKQYWQSDYVKELYPDSKGRN